MRKFLLGLVTVLGAVLLLAGCGSSSSTSGSKEITLGVTAGPHAAIADKVAEEAKKEGLHVKVVEFSDYLTPDQALADGSLDMNNYQHEPFLLNFDKQKGTHLVALGKTVIQPMGLYSNSFHSVAAITPGTKVAIPNDPTNGGRALQLLAQAGLITLKTDVGVKATLSDITSNPKDLKIVELDAAQLPRSLSDVGVAAIPMNYAISGNLDVEKQGFFFESKTNPLATIVLAVREQDKDNPTYKKVLAIYHSQAVKDFINEKFKGEVIPAE